jgi:thiamine biosynthesis lipoprotein
MGMPIIIDVRDPEIGPEVLDRAFAWLRFVDTTFSTYKPDSDISRLNRGELTLAEAHPDVAWVLDRCEQLRAATDGYFDIHAPYLSPEKRAADGMPPGAVDPSGLVKGWSVDRAAQLLEAAGAQNYCFNAGGDIRVRGGALPESQWRIGIQHPLQRDRIADVVVSDDLAIATSGAYERGQHILNPHTGLPPTAVLSVTIVGPDLGAADAFATAAYAMDLEGPQWTARLIGYQAMTILADHIVLKTRAFPDR